MTKMLRFSLWRPSEIQHAVRSIRFRDRLQGQQHVAPPAMTPRLVPMQSKPADAERKPEAVWRPGGADLADKASRFQNREGGAWRGSMRPSRPSATGATSTRGEPREPLASHKGPPVPKRQKIVHASTVAPGAPAPSSHPQPRAGWAPSAGLAGLAGPTRLAPACDGRWFAGLLVESITTQSHPETTAAPSRLDNEHAVVQHGIRPQPLCSRRVASSAHRP
ncbi:hypothetical protein B0J13DRAFT_660815 [Dactylonectria estremocensis]|uniref:Uncharacterized protein n=1 Tax=Dactylonectria estremocensis TaxID=1079267 RepID=A0A9P9JA63_9HYPO|nr:hypothetical protein B0J13DRAFT_660815 [Dactylonectria estremocensis]